MQMHRSYGTQELNDDCCFLCGALMDGSKSAEHVFPKWLQNRYDLWNQKIELLNGSLMPYRQLTIPCCEKCNNEHLSSLENGLFVKLCGTLWQHIQLSTVKQYACSEAFERTIAPSIGLYRLDL